MNADDDGDDDDKLLRALAGEARRERQSDDDRLDERWDRLAAGELSAAEEAELARLARTAAGTAAAHEAHEAFRPLDAAFRKRVVKALQAAAVQPAVAPPRSGRQPGRRRRGWLGAAAVAAAAAAAALVLWPAFHPPLPDYEIQVTGGEAKSRGGPAPGAPPRGETVYLLRPGDRLEIEARPKAAVGEPVAARWFAVRRGEEPRLLGAPRPEIAPSGAVRFAATLGRDLDLAPGPWSLWVMVGREGDLPDAALLRSRGAVAAGSTLRQRDWIVWRAAEVRVARAGEP